MNRFVYPVFRSVEDRLDCGYVKTWRNNDGFLVFRSVEDRLDCGQLPSELGGEESRSSGPSRTGSIAAATPR